MFANIALQREDADPWSTQHPCLSACRAPSLAEARGVRFYRLREVKPIPRDVEGMQVTVAKSAVPTGGRLPVWTGTRDRLVRLADSLARGRWLALPLLAAAMAMLRVTDPPADLMTFGELGRAALSGHLGVPYATDYNQGGPLQLLAAAPVPEHVLRSMFLLRITVAVWGAMVAIAAMWLTRGIRRFLGLPSSALLELASGAVAALWLAGGDLFSGHLAELMIPASWVAGATAARRGNLIVAGALLGTSAAWEPWGLLGVPIVLLAPRLRDVIVTFVTGLAAAALLYLPFVLAGPFALLEHRWPIDNATLDHSLWPHATTFGWGLRLLQAAACTAIGGAVALRVRRHVCAIWLVPLVIILVRLTFDPTDFQYYWVAAQVALVAGIAVINPRRRLASLLFVAIAWCVSTSWGAWRTVDTIAALVLAVVLAEVERRAGEPGDEGHRTEARSPTSSGQPVVDRDVGDVDADHRLAQSAGHLR
jgi:hypothetical protein